MRPIQLVVFDLAGTTIEDEGGVVLQSLVESAQAYELPGTPEELNALMGMNKREVLAQNTARFSRSTSPPAGCKSANCKCCAPFPSRGRCYHTPCFPASPSAATRPSGRSRHTLNWSSRGWISACATTGYICSSS